MDAKELVKQLAKHPVVVSDMSMQVQLGIPFLDKNKDRLCISFKPHMEKLIGERIEFYRPQYEISWVYPFKHLVSFLDLDYVQSIDANIPEMTISLEHFRKKGIFLITKLYEECTRVLTLQEKDGKVSDVTLNRYQQLYYEVVQELGLNSIYGDGKL